jgi:hypothetical protein
MKPKRQPAPPPPPSKAPAPEADDFADPGNVSGLVFEAVAPLDALYERWPSGLSIRPLINMVRERLNRFEAWEREQEKRRRGNGAA